MYNLQAALNERLASLKNISPGSNPSDKTTSKEYIILTLKQAGILDQNGKMVNKITTSK